MLYDLLELLLGPLLTKQEQKMPKCRTCKKRMEQMGPPRLFLLPVYSDGRYSASADYFMENCVPIQQEGGDPYRPPGLPDLEAPLSCVRRTVHVCPGFPAGAAGRNSGGHISL